MNGYGKTIAIMGSGLLLLAAAARVALGSDRGQAPAALEALASRLNLLLLRGGLVLAK